MQFNFNCQQVLGCDNEGFSILEGSFSKAIKPGHILYVNEILDTMGHLSSKAQGLNTIITSSQKFFSSNHRIFIKAKDNKVTGYLKVGEKKLFVRDQSANYFEITPLCVLDFYIYETEQRGGQGKAIFDFMLNFENIGAKLLAYDRPSTKLVGFLKKYFKLGSYISQNNNFLLFNEYFEDLNTNRNLNLRHKSLKNSDITTGNLENNRGNFANVGHNLMYNSTYSISQKTKEENGLELNNDKNFNSIQKQYTGNNRSNNNNSNHGFSNYFLNNNTNYYDQMFSKKKLDLLNDYSSKEKFNADEYVKEQLNFRERETFLAKERVKQLESNIDSNSPNFYDYQKKNDFKTIFDDKKLLEKKQLLKSLPDNNASRDRGISCSNYKNVTISDMLPTTSAAYGLYYNNDYKKNFFY